jgi:hypothetical protein
VEDPEGQGFRGPFGQDDEAPENLDQCVEQDVTGDGRGPGGERGLDYWIGGWKVARYWIQDAGWWMRHSPYCVLRIPCFVNLRRRSFRARVPELGRVERIG